MKIKLITLAFALLSSTISFADKPSWAGNGGKPSKYEKKQHKKEMNSKHKYKKNKHDKHDHEYSRDRDEDYDREHTRDRNKDYDREHSIERAITKQKVDDALYIKQKVDETHRNWIDKAFDFLN